MRRKSVQAAGLVVGLAAFAGCAEGPNLAFSQSNDEQGTAAAPARAKAEIIAKDVEAPEVFETSEAGLWDGRPSLGGIWVAHPDVDEPERVIVRNSATGKTVVGALFRRERDMPGPRLQASSDAAAELGMLAGAPVELQVTALRREEVAPEPAPEEKAEVADETKVAATVEPADETQTVAAVEPAADAVAADDATDSPLAEAAVATAAVAAGAVDTVADAKPARKRKGFIFPWNRKKAERESAAKTVEQTELAAAPIIESETLTDVDNIEDTVARPDEATDAAAAMADTAVEIEPEVKPARKRKKFVLPWNRNRANRANGAPLDAISADDIAPVTTDAITETTLDPIAGAAAAIDAAAPATDASVIVSATQDAAAETAAAKAAAEDARIAEKANADLQEANAAPATSQLRKPFIQVGLFTIEENASQTADRMRRSGVVPTVLPQEEDGETIWRVVVGPAESRSERAALLKSVKSSGFSDAYFVTN